MLISIAVCTHNEGIVLRDLLTKLVAAKNSPLKGLHSYEIIVVDDFSDDPETLSALYDFAKEVRFERHRLNGDFATHKNEMNSFCKGEWILNLDADEFLSDDLLHNLPLILEANPAVEAYWLPRINTVEGLTLDHVVKWGWVLTQMEDRRTVKPAELLSAGERNLLEAYKFIIEEADGFVRYYEPIINWPDIQMRLYRNDPKIKWQGRVHEMLSGFTHFSTFPMHPDFAIRHFKEIARQEAQNTLYATIQR
jgi:glycosyltransferase involved in cell wall biosynthesis